MTDATSTPSNIEPIKEEEFVLPGKEVAPNDRTEIKSKRSLNAKHFAKDNGEFVMDSHVGHIHYFDRLDSKRFREIDWTLKFDEVRRGWYFNYHSFRPFLPEYADGWVEFRDLFNDKDQTIRYKAKASHIKGRLVQPKEIGLEKETGVNCVIYDDAFGKGHDYILYFTRSTLKKVVRIREEFKGKEELRFTWDIDFGKREVYRANRKEDVEMGMRKKTKMFATKMAYTFDKTRAKTFDSAKQTLIGDSKLDDKEWFTYLRSFKCWDSGEERQTETVKVDYDATNKTITKIITADFLAKSVGDVFTDTTTSYYAGAGDGYVGIYAAGNPSQSLWDTVHDATSGDAAQTVDDNTEAVFILGSALFRGSKNYLGIHRGFIPIDTSSIPSGATVSSASLFMYVYSTSDSTNDGYGYVQLVGQTSQASVNSIITDDYDECSTTDSPTTISDTYDITNIVISAYLEMPLTNLSVVSKTGYTKIGSRSGWDIEDVYSEPGSVDKDNRVGCRTSEYTGTDYDPYLSITYTEGSSTPADDAIFFGMNF